MFSSLRARLWLSYALIIVTAFGVVAMIMFITLLRNPALNRQTIERLNAIQTIIVQRDGQQSLRAAAERSSRVFDVRILLYSPEGRILFDTKANSESLLPFPGDNRIARNSPLSRDENGKLWLYSRAQLSDGTILLVASPRPRLSLVNIFADDILPLFAQSGLMALGLALIVAYIFARWIGDPLQRIVLAARGMPSLEARAVGASGPQEVQELTRAFNSMVSRVQKSQQSQRDFVANVSHELKTPLTSIQGFSQAILDGTADSSEKREHAAQVIFDEAARMHRMVLDLLDLARLDAGTADITFSAVHLAPLLNAIGERFAPQSQKSDVRIEISVPLELPAVSADGDKLSQVFANLVDNALKVTPRGGSIQFRASNLKREIVVSVTDSGPGIPPQAQAHIFDRFYQADPARAGGATRGAGLGLAIAREIVEAHGGRISVRSRVGEGTTFDVFLPLTRSYLP